MPEISRFLGIVIAMFYKDHAPPHFHAMYGDYEITVEIESGVINGRFPKRALRHVIEWHELHVRKLAVRRRKETFEENCTFGVVL